MSGQQVYDQFCFACHATGITDAPRFANSEDWAPRVAKGMDTMLQTTLSGLKFMPPKGTCMACSDGELQAAVDYMIGSAQ
jgi:cytochrome c5